MDRTLLVSSSRNSEADEGVMSRVEDRTHAHLARVGVGLDTRSLQLESQSVSEEIVLAAGECVHLSPMFVVATSHRNLAVRTSRAHVQHHALDHSFIRRTIPNEPLFCIVMAECIALAPDSAQVGFREE